MPARLPPQQKWSALAFAIRYWITCPTNTPHIYSDGRCPNDFFFNTSHTFCLEISKLNVSLPSLRWYSPVVIETKSTLFFFVLHWYSMQVEAYLRPFHISAVSVSNVNHRTEGTGPFCLFATNTIIHKHSDNGHVEFQTRSWFSDVPFSVRLCWKSVSMEYVVHFSHHRN